MPAALVAILPTLIQLIPVVTAGVENLIAFIQSIRTAAQQTAEWTPAMESAFLDALLARANSPAYKPDPK